MPYPEGHGGSAVALVIELPQDIEVALRAEAQAHGVTLEAWVETIAAAWVRPVEAPRSLQDELTPEEWVREFHAWAESHDRTTPLLSDEAISRESIYPDWT